ncbi:MAG: SOS response-associated peptidase [Ilumatobacteraceae bacterium]
MCGRFVSSTPPDQLANFFGTEAPDVELPANFNVAPTQDIYAVTSNATGARTLAPFHWGLVPTWAKDLKVGNRMINARAETVAEKSAFKPLLKKHRCLVPMSGFYEWRAGSADGPLTKAGKPMKQPMFIARPDGEPLVVAGLWATWRDRSAGEEAPWLHSCTLITTSANDTMAPIHDRMPVFLAESDWDRWLDPTFQDLDALTALLVPAANDLLTTRPVSPDVNRVTNNSPELLAPYDPTT